jgi:hypothetical protein
MKEAISVQLFAAWLVRHIQFKAGNDIAFEDLRHDRINRLAHHKEWLAIHGVDPIVSGHAQTQALTRAT